MKNYKNYENMWNMKKACITLFLWCVYCIGYAQTVTNVRFEQVNKQVKITYTLDKQADISVSVSEDGGTTWHAPLKQVSGDVGKQVQPGSKTIYWDVLAEYDQFVGTNICFKVTPKGNEQLNKEEQEYIENSGLQKKKNFNVKVTKQSDGSLLCTINGVSFTMVYLQGGTLSLGSTPEQEKNFLRPVRKVTLDDFYIGKYEVTQELWTVVMGTTIFQQSQKGEFSQTLWGVGNNYPMYYISYEDCLQFIDKLNELLYTQLGGKHFVLPTLDQWEYAARGGQKSRHYKYAGSNDVEKVAWHANNSLGTIHMVGQKLPNELGLYDMSGNVAEWCLKNELDDTFSGQMGGSCFMLPTAAAVAVRFTWDIKCHSVGEGFRIALIP